MLRSLARDLFYGASAWRLPKLNGAFAKWLELSSLQRFLRDEQIDTVLDVGANVGQFAAKLRRLGFTGRIISFEPDPRAFQQLVARHGKDPKWQGMPFALGDATGSIDFHLTHNSVLSSILNPVHAGNIAESVSVKVSRLDDVFDELLGPDAKGRIFLKTDTQGYDLAVLRGAAACLPKVHGILCEISVVPIYEASPSVEESLAAYRAAGFALMDLTLINRTPDGRVLEYDGLFRRV